MSPAKIRKTCYDVLNSISFLPNFFPIFFARKIVFKSIRNKIKLIGIKSNSIFNKIRYGIRDISVSFYPESFENICSVNPYLQMKKNQKYVRTYK